MKTSVYEQFAIVKEDSASLFTERLNEAMRSLRDKAPAVKFSKADPLCAYINFTVKDETPETVSEASEIVGVSFICAQCPHFVPPLKEDGTEDRRCKYGDCEHADLGRTYKTARACDRLYRLIADGDVKVVFREED